MMAADGWYIYTGREVVPRHVTRVRIHESLTVIPARAFQGNLDIEELDCHDRVKTVEENAFYCCFSLRIVIMPGVTVVERYAFDNCNALTDVECDKLERIGYEAFSWCKSLTIINLPSAKIVERYAFAHCEALTNVIFGKELESIGEWAFYCCTSLEQITIPLNDGIITDDSIFGVCEKLKHIDLVEGEQLRDTIAALLLEEWKNDMNDKLGVINQSLPTTPAGDEYEDVGEKALAIRRWIRTVLRNIDRYKAQHHSYLNEAATTLQLALPQDIVIKNVLSFLELPSYTFEGED
ncbi:leucine-rich repeat domain-containing protein [Skeletonema marinoi]|uniref:Leucine-rich repeat domain-containing protein n=1 Tax=Skeletonema marinoi TaxID=267567 RepID=A0AAD8XTR4_9STRA|nr:leucine-rich repeat domain-containing protein [Skeletonema marinoi]KAK1733344.1 leucine-rich repeat domain-containing protein [Skeletonema marinoi]